MGDRASLQATVHGHVQGVLFRDFVRRQALSLGLAGYVKNLPDGESVQVVAEGEAEKLHKLLEQLKLGPPRSRVDRVETNEGNYTGSYTGFKIRR